MSIRETLSKLPERKFKETMLKYILKDVDTTESIYKKTFQETYKVNWDVFGLIGYQIYEPNKYTSKFGEHLEDPNADITIRDMDYFRKALKGEKVGIEAGRDNKKMNHLYRKTPFIYTRTRTNEGNAQVLIAKIPIFKQIVRDFGTSRQARILHDEPDPISPIEKGEIELLMKKMLAESIDINDDIYKNNFKNLILKVNWDIDGNVAYQILKETEYKYEIGKQLENADLTLVIKNPELAKRFFLGFPTNYAPILDEDNNLIVTIKTPILSVKFKKSDETVRSLIRIPFFRALLLGSAEQPTLEENKKDKRENYGHYIPVNLPMGDYENVVVPYKVFEHFINKASNIVLRTCPCRERWDCQNHSIEYGCIFMGDDTKNMVLSPDQGYKATKKQALEHVKNAIADGLVPIIGRNVAEAEDGHGVKDTGRFLAGCFCCECCCIGVKTRQYSSILSEFMVGETSDTERGFKIKIDQEKCTGCGTCLDVCVFKGRKVLEGKATVDPDNCIACGRCVDACPNGAISFEIEDPDYFQKYIAKIESIVDVTDQNA